MYSAEGHMTMDESDHLKGDRIVHLGQMSVTWDSVRSDRGLKSDTDIASFLLRYYEDTCSGHQSAAHCTYCHTALVLMCPKCTNKAKTPLPEKETVHSMDGPVGSSAASSSSSSSTVHDVIDLPQLSSMDSYLPDIMETTSDSKGMAASMDLPTLTTPHREANFEREAVSSEPSLQKRSLGSVNATSESELPLGSRNETSESELPFGSSDSEVPFLELSIEERGGTEDDDSETKSVCPHCSSEFAHPVGLTRHLSLQICYTNTEPAVPPILGLSSSGDTFKCSLCSSVFFEPDLLTKHMSIHAEHMPFKCADCGAGFLKENVLELHMQKHKGRYTCTRCKAEFANAIGLTRHMKSSDCKAAPEPVQKTSAESVYAPENRVGARSSERVQARREETTQSTDSWDEEGQGKFECDKCGKKWHNQYNLERHMLTHTGQRSFACQECGATFLQQCHLVSHVRRKHVPAKPIKCGKCGMTFVTPSGLEKHTCQPPAPPEVFQEPHTQLRFHKPRRGRPPKSKPIKPVLTEFLASKPSCVRTPSRRAASINSDKMEGGRVSQTALRRERVKAETVKTESVETPEAIQEPVDSRPHKCEYCQAEFTYVNDLTAHLQKHTGQKEFKCTQCDAAFRKAHNLTRHLRKHSEPQQVCSYCGMTFATSTQLTVHVRVHTGETPFKCEICGAAFREKRNWKIHQRTHTGEKPYLCEDCGRSFSQVNNYRRHTRVHTGERPYACQQCPRTFSDKSNLAHHLRMHAGLKPHECQQCGKFFRESYSLKIHMRSHTKEKPYKCSQCGSAFSMDSSLTKHMRVHTGEKPYECPICGRKFANPSNRAAHVRTHKRLNPI